MKRKYTSLLLACLMLSAQAWAELTQIGNIYQIGTAQDLADFAALVNSGTANVKAELTADIDYTSKNVQIGLNGNASTDFTGYFDGRGHTITYSFSGGTIKGENAALFFNMKGTVVNLKVTGTINHAYDNAGGIAYYNYGTIRGCISDVDFTLTKSGSCSSGGIAGVIGSTAVIEKCIFTGSFGGTNATNVGGIVGWCASGNIRDCLVIASSKLAGDFKSVTRLSGSGPTISNCFYMQDGGTTTISANSGSIAVTSSQIESGEIAYKLGLTQTIGTESIPNAFGNSSKVYGIGSCIADEATGFTNTKASGTPHTFSNFVCSVCSTTKTSPDGFYELDSKEDLEAFAALVTGGTTAANARLMKDIDMSDVDMSPIGTDSKRYVGTFDGQGHTISNLVMSGESGFGLFTTGANVILRDFFLESNCTITGKAQTGVIGSHSGANGSFIKIGSAAKIVSTGGGNVGGLIGNCWCSSGTVTLNSCWMVGSVTSSGTNQNNNGLFIGWANSGTVNLTNCWTIGTMNHWDSYDKFLVRYGATLNFDNCYTVTGTQVQGITTSDVASGRLCFLLNKGNTTSPEWYQTIGVDAVPTLNNTHGIVYAKYNLDCDGATPTEGSIGYANEATAGMTGATSRAHNYSAGVCTQCGQTEANANVYTISTAEQFRHFAHGVEAGNRNINATLASDIDLSELTMPLPMIGTNGNYYSGTFDGQGYAIHNFSLTSSENYAGLISYLYGGTVKNFSIDGTMNLSGKYAGGIIGQTNSICTVSGIHSTVDITASGSADDRLGGIIGYANGSKTTITDCTNGGSITLPISFNQSAGGIIGGGYNNLNIDNCVFYGTIKATGSDKKANFGGMIGYLNSTNMDHMKNCISAGTIELDEGRTFSNCNALIASRTKDQTAAIGLTDCYWTDLGLPSVVTKALPDGTDGTSTQITAEKAARGELAWMLNGNSSDGTWTQTLGTQPAPLPISTGDKVYPFATSGENKYFVNNTESPVVPVMTLTDKADYEADGTFTATSLTYDRELKAGGYHSLCLPFAINNTGVFSEKGGKLFTLKEKDENYVTLEETPSVAAGVPCFASVTSDFNFGTMSNVAMVKDVDNSGTIKGTFTKITGAGAVGVYKLDSYGKYFAKTAAVEGDVTEAPVIWPFRSYIAAGGVSVKTLNILLSDGTSLTPTLSEEKEAVIYDLAGRRVAKATKGIYIVNGKKVMK